MLSLVTFTESRDPHESSVALLSYIFSDYTVILFDAQTEPTTTRRVASISHTHTQTYHIVAVSSTFYQVFSFFFFRPSSMTFLWVQLSLAPYFFTVSQAIVSPSEWSTSVPYRVSQSLSSAVHRPPFYFFYPHRGRDVFGNHVVIQRGSVEGNQITPTLLVHHVSIPSTTRGTRDEHVTLHGESTNEVSYPFPSQE